VVLIRQPNAGGPAALNRGLSVARGEHVACIDSDDAYLPTRIATLLDALRRDKAVLAFSDVEFIGPEGAPAVDQPRAIELRERIDALRTYPNHIYRLVASNVAVSTGNLMFTRELLARIGGFRDLKLCYDWDFLLAASYVGALAHVAAPLYRYRLHDGNSSLGRLHAAEETEAVYRRFFAAIDRHPLLPDDEGRSRFLRFFAHAYGRRAYFPAPAARRKGSTADAPAGAGSL